MAKPKHPYFDAILSELSVMPNVKSHSIFGHQGYSFGTSVFAFLDNESLVVRSEKYRNKPDSLPRDLSFFLPEIFTNLVWIGITIDDSLSGLRKHWGLIEESYKMAIERESVKELKAKRQAKKA
jgi:hypothetical protein